jgi:hypothetical protein
MKSTKSYRGSGRPANRRARRRLELEPLEVRQLLAVAAVDDIGANFNTDEDVPLVSSSANAVTIDPAGGEWRYFSTNNDIGFAWRQPNFDPGVDDPNDPLDWGTGNAPLGYGDAHIVTEVPWGPTGDNNVDAAAFKNFTYRFRREFQVADASAINALTVNLMRDDGALVFINGTFVVADGLDQFAENFDPGGGPPAENAFIPFIVDPSVLVDGTNLIAVEIHQASRTSSDVAMDVSLTSPGATPILENDDLSNANGQVIASVLSPPVDSVSGASAGAVVMDAGGNFTFTPAANYSGTATFDYEIVDDDNQPSIGTVTIVVAEVLADPVALNDSSVTIQGQPVTTVANDNPIVFMDYGATWSFLDNGTDQGGLGTFDAGDNTWFAAPNFDDSGWVSGAAEFGYGDADHVTLVDFGPDPNVKFTTSYYRSTFGVANSASVGFLGLGLVADDSAAVYINGVEAYRLRLAADAAFDVFAVGGGAAPGDGHPATETLIDLNQLGIPLMDTGNTIAVEIHQATLTSSDLHFDMAISEVPRSGVLDNDSDEDGATLEIVGVIDQPNGGTVVLNADGSYTYTPAEGMVGVDTFTYQIREVAAPAVTATATVTITVVNIPDAPVAGTDAYRVADPAGGETLTVAAIAPVDLAGVDATRMITFGDDWRYLDNGSDQGTAWRANGFDDTPGPARDDWKEGPAELGYGDPVDPNPPMNPPEATQILFGADPDNANNDAANKFVTTYFRNTFATDAAVTPGTDTLYFSLLSDDGAVAYLNGTEISSTFLIDNPAFDQHAFVAEPDDGQIARVYEIDSSLLNPVGGADNVLAVEVHQVNLTSSDLSFDAELLVPNAPIGVLVNDSDADFNALTAAILVAPPNAETFTFNPDGTFDYDPNDGFNGIDTFTYTLSDGTGNTSVGTVNISVGVATVPPQVLTVEINSDKTDNAPLPKGPLPSTWAAQRSEIFTIVAEFDQDMSVSLNDLVLTNLGKDVAADPDAVVDLAAIGATANVVGSTLTVTFVQNTLTDGGYSLEILPTATNLTGQGLDGNGDGSSGGSFTTSANQTNDFYRLLSDYSGDRGISVFDFTSFSYWFGTDVGTAAGEAPAFVDTSFDGGISVFDFTDFSNNFGQLVTLPVALAGRIAGLPSDDVTIDRADEGNEVEQAIEQPVVLWRNDIRRDDVENSTLNRNADVDVDDNDLLDVLASDVGQIWK